MLCKCFHVLLLLVCITHKRLHATLVTMNGGEFISYDVTYNKIHQHKLVVVFKFRTVNPSGLILFSHNEAAGDFISMELIDGHIRYKAQLGSEKYYQQELVVGSELNDDQWHTVDLKLEGLNATLSIVDEFKASKTFGGAFTRLDLDHKIYFGGVDDTIVDLAPFKITKRKFAGCLESFFFNDQDILFNAKFSRPNYLIAGDLLWNKCQDLNYYPITFQMPQHFALIPTSLTESLNVVFTFRTHIGEGLLFSKISPMVTVFLYLQKGVLFYKVQIKGQGPLTMTRGKNLHDGFWHRVEILINKKTIYIKVDKYASLEHKSLWGDLIEFSIGNATIGGGEEQVFIGFTGCIYNIWVDDTEINYKKLGRAYMLDAVEGCEIKDRCLFSPCQNGGICSQDHNSYKCDCFHTMYDGNHCEKSIYQTSCQEYKDLGLNEDSKCLIDPDGNGPFKPTEVLCNMTRYADKAVTVFKHNLGNIQTPVNAGNLDGSFYWHTLVYSAEMEQFDTLLKSADSCRQYIQFKCINSILFRSGPEILANTIWMGRPGSFENYWGGAPPNSEKCACGVTNTCDYPFIPCNCDIGDNIWREDSGYFREMDRLPVLFVQFKTSSNQSLFTVGNLECKFNATKDVEKLSKIRVLKACKPLIELSTTRATKTEAKLNQKETFISFNNRKPFIDQNKNPTTKVIIEKPFVSNVNFNFTVELPKVESDKKEETGLKLTLSFYAVIAIVGAACIIAFLICIVIACKRSRKRQRRRNRRRENNDDDDDYQNEETTEMCTFFGSVSAARVDRNRPVLEVHRHSFHLEGIDELPPAYRDYGDYQQPIHTHIDLSYKSRRKKGIFC